MRKKYAEQDEEDRALALQVLGAWVCCVGCDMYVHVCMYVYVFFGIHD